MIKELARRKAEKIYDDHEHRLTFIEGAEFGYNQRWIPVSEAMPKEEDANKYKQVFSLNKNGVADAIYYGFIVEDSENFYIAWMPIPKYTAE